MESELLILDVIQRVEEEGHAPRVRLVTRSYPSDARGLVMLTPECQSLEHLERAIGRLKVRLDTLLKEGGEVFRRNQAEKDAARRSVPRTPQEIWKAMEGAGDPEGMRQLFNPLPFATRKEVANFIFTHVNIFKGAASLFSQHFNEEACLLD